MLGRPDDTEGAAAIAAVARRSALRNRVLALLVGALAFAVLGAGVFISASWSAARSDTCETWDPVDISIDDLIALKRRKNAWQASMDEEAALVMTDREVNFILRGTTDYGLHATFLGDRVEARLTAPYEGGCFNVRYAGNAVVASRVVTFTPERLVVGELDLTPYVGGIAWSFEPESLEGWVDPRVLDALDNADGVEIRDSAVHIRLHDRRKVW